MLNRVLLFILLALVSGCLEKEKSYTSLDDAATDKIGVLLGSSRDDFISNKYPNADILRVNTSSDLIAALKAGSCDVAIFRTTESVELLKANPDLTILEENLYSKPLGVGFNKNSTDIRDKFNLFLAQIKSEGLYDQIIKRWTEDFENAQMPEIRLPETGIPLKIGTTARSTPFSFDKDEKLSGIDIEIITRFAAYLNRPVEFQEIDLNNLIPTLISDKVDVIINCIMITEERASKVAFSDEYFQSTAIALTRKKNKTVVQSYRSINDLCEKRIGVITGSIQDDYITKNFPKATIFRVNDIPSLFLALKNDKCDVISMGYKAFKLAVKKHPEISILDKKLIEREMALGFSLNNTALREEFNNMLTEFRSDGTYDEIYKRWISEDNPVMPKIDIPKEGIPIRVGITGTTPPFDYQQNGEPAGFDTELVKHFAKRLERPVEFQIISMGGLIAALHSEKVDLIAAGVIITPERSKNVAFANHHHLSKSITAVLTKNIATKENESNPIVQDKDKQHFLDFLKDSFYSNLIVEKRYIIILNGLWETLLISVFSALLGTLLGALVCFMRMSKKTILNSIAKTYITIMRSIPLLVLLMLFYYVFFAKWNISATIIAIITFALNFAAYVSVMFRTSIENVDRGQTEAAIAMGFTKIQTFFLIVMPQAIKSVFPAYKGGLISLVKTTSIVGYIAIEDLTKASDIIRSKTFDAFFPLIMVSIIYFLLAKFFITILNKINTKITSR